MTHEDSHHSRAVKRGVTTSLECRAVSGDSVLCGVPKLVTPEGGTVPLYAESMTQSLPKGQHTLWIGTYRFPPASSALQLRTVASHKRLSDSYTSSYVQTSVFSGRSGHNILPEIH